MPISRRVFLTTAAVMNTSALYSSSAFSCDGGGLMYCPIPLPPSDFVLDSIDESSVETFLNEKYGNDAWSYSSLPISFTAPEISENSIKIPVEIRTDDPSLVGRYRSMEVLVHRIVKVWDTEKFRIPRHAPERFMISRVAKFKLSEQIVPYISMRIQNHDSGELRMIAVFTPVDRSKRIEVVKQNKTIKIMRCYFDKFVYVDGRWPKGLSMECMKPL